MKLCWRHAYVKRGAASAKPVSEPEEVGEGRAVLEQLLGMEGDAPPAVFTDSLCLQ